jgi:predicted Zn-dependent peptidase
VRLAAGIRGGSLALFAVASPVAGQVGDYAYVGVGSGQTTSVAVAALHLQVGSSDDPVGMEGTAWLLGAILSDQTNAALAGTSATVSAVVGRSTTIYTMTAPRDRWGASWATLAGVIFSDLIQPAALERSRAALSATSAFEGASPTADFGREAAGLLAPPSHPWAQPPKGDSESLASITDADLQRFRDERYRPASASVGLVGTGDARDVIARVDPAPRPEIDSIAWTEGRRVTIAQDVTSAWLAISYPLPARAGRTELEFITQLVSDAVEPPVPDPSLFSMHVRLVDAPHGPVVTIETVVSPSAAAVSERRIMGAVRGLAERPPAGELFQFARRRFRAARLLEESYPENAAGRIAADLMRSGVARNLQDEIWGIDSRSLAGALALLGEPRVFFLGPDPRGPQG